MITKTGFRNFLRDQTVGTFSSAVTECQALNLTIIMFIRITSRTDSTITKISGAIKTSVRAAVHNYYPKATKEKGTNSTQKTAVAYRFRKEIYRILSCT